MSKMFYGKGIPGIDPSELQGALIVIEGADGSGRSTQARLLKDWLERLGYPATEIGLKRSTLVGPELEVAMEGNIMGPTTLSLFYATDLTDQIENNIIPALRAGFVVIADRYIYTLMARDIVRGASPDWISSVYDVALVPDIVFGLKVSPKVLVERSFQKQGQLNYWESGMDIQRSGDMYQCFIRYQAKMAKEYERLARKYKFVTLDGGADPYKVHEQMKTKVAGVLETLKGQRQPAKKSASSNVQIKRRGKKPARAR